MDNSLAPGVRGLTRMNLFADHSGRNLQETPGSHRPFRFDLNFLHYFMQGITTGCGPQCVPVTWNWFWPQNTAFGGAACRCDGCCGRQDAMTYPPF